MKNSGSLSRIDQISIFDRYGGGLKLVAITGWLVVRFAEKNNGN